jgi:hypothetical protein
MGLLDYLKAFFRPGAPPPEPRRLDGRSKPLLAASLKMLPDEEPGWMTMKEAKTLFSQGEAYAFGEMDEAGKADLAAFAGRLRVRECSIRVHAGPGSALLHAQGEPVANVTAFAVLVDPLSVEASLARPRSA